MLSGVVNAARRGAVLVCALLAPLPLHADLVTSWNGLGLAAIRLENTAPPLGARNLAITHTAIFEAVNAITLDHRPYGLALPSTPGASVDAAILSAAYHSLVNLFPSERALFEEAYTRGVAGLDPGTARDAGLNLGRAAAFGMLALRAADGSSTMVPYIPGTAPGDWRRTPPFFRPPDLPHWRYVTPFTLERPDQFRPAGPPPLGSDRWAADLNQVQELGARNSSRRTPYQSESAVFWSDFSYTVTPPGHWNEIAADISARHDSSSEDNARLFALLNLALADAAIAAWDAKYEYNLWRPVTAIRAADTDGNPLTLADPDWEPFLVTPAHPDYLSGHSTFSAAAAAVLAGFYGTADLAFDVESDALPGVVRSYDNVDVAAEEIGLSRIWGGIHYLSSDLDGLATGEAVGEQVVSRFLLPIPEPGAGRLFLLGLGLAGLRRRRRRPVTP